MAALKREYRYERKFFVEGMNAKQVISLLKLHPAMLSQIYPPRCINNIYLDSLWMDGYYDNLCGASERQKTRVRWYHHLFRLVPDGVLEFKIKRGLVGTKLQHPFPTFMFDTAFSLPSFREILRRADLPQELLARLAGLEPVLVNRYQRWYFATPDQRFRVTVDTGLTFYHLHKFRNNFTARQVDYDHIVVEMKYHAEDDPQADRITAGFPFRVTRSSKYVQGIESVYL